MSLAVFHHAVYPDHYSSMVCNSFLIPFGMASFAACIIPYGEFTDAFIAIPIIHVNILVDTSVW